MSDIQKSLQPSSKLDKSSYYISVPYSLRLVVLCEVPDKRRERCCDIGKQRDLETKY